MQRENKVTEKIATRGAALHRSTAGQEKESKEGRRSVRVSQAYLRFICPTLGLDLEEQHQQQQHSGSIH